MHCVFSVFQHHWCLRVHCIAEKVTRCLSPFIFSLIYLPPLHISQGINNLQSTCSGFGFVSAENVFKVSSFAVYWSQDSHVICSHDLVTWPNHMTWSHDLITWLYYVGLWWAPPPPNQGDDCALSEGRHQWSISDTAHVMGQGLLIWRHSVQHIPCLQDLWHARISQAGVYQGEGCYVMRRLQQSNPCPYGVPYGVPFVKIFNSKWMYHTRHPIGPMLYQQLPYCTCSCTYVLELIRSAVLVKLLHCIWTANYAFLLYIDFLNMWLRLCVSSFYRRLALLSYGSLRGCSLSCSCLDLLLVCV